MISGHDRRGTWQAISRADVLGSRRRTPTVMAGLVPVITTNSVPQRRAGTGPAMTGRVSAHKGYRSLWSVLPLVLVISGFPLATFADPPTRAPDWGLPQLMAQMQTVHGATARFVERKFVQVLNQPLQSSGALTYVAPDRLQKQTLAPARARLSVDGDRLTVEQPDGKTSNLSLSEVPEIGALVASIRATLAGDSATLTRYYTLTLTGNAGDWSLLLEPRDHRLRDLLTMIRIRGEGNVIRSIETLERDGDRTEMTITPDPG